MIGWHWCGPCGYAARTWADHEGVEVPLEKLGHNERAALSEATARLLAALSRGTWEDLR